MSDVTYEVPLNAQLAHCRGCGQSIYWVKTPAGRNMPVNPGAKTAHWGTCPKAADFRRKKEARP